MSDWSLRLARPADAAALGTIEQAAASLFRQDEDLAFLADAPPRPMQRFAALIRRGHSLVATQQGDICGFLIGVPSTASQLHIVELSVHPRAQRQGIGAGLLRAAAVDAGNCGYSALTLTTFADLPWNAPFYERLGFAPVTDLDSEPRLAEELRLEAEKGLPMERRLAMIRQIG